MTAADRAFLGTQLSALRRMLEERPAGDVLGRWSLSAQIADFEEQVSKLSDSSFSPATARLAFTGAAIADTRGIEPAFASQVCSLFDELVRLVRAEETQQTLKEEGPIPTPEGAGRLLITNVVRGSFGFEFVEEAPEQADLPFEISPTAKALERVSAMLGAVAQGGEAWENAAPASPRTLAKLRDFIMVLDRGDATLRLDTGAAQVELGHEAVQQALGMASSTRLNDTVEERDGFLSVLPLAGRFQLLTEDKALAAGIEGALSPKLSSADVEHLYDLQRKWCRVALRGRQLFRGDRLKETWTLLHIATAGVEGNLVR